MSERQAVAAVEARESRVFEPWRQLTTELVR
jgi:hypothetical protein